MTVLRSIGLVTFAILTANAVGQPLAVFAQPAEAPLAPLFRPVSKLPDGAAARVGDSPFVLSERHYDIALSPDGKRIAAGVSKVAVYDADTGKAIRLLVPEAGAHAIHKLVWARDNRHLLVIRYDRLRIWDTTTDKQLWDAHLKTPQYAGTLSARFLANDKLIAVVYQGPRVDVFDVATGKPRDSWTVGADRQKQIAALGEGYEAWQVALSPSGELMAWLAISPNGTGSGVLVYETASGKLLHTLAELPYTTALDMPDEKSLVLHPVPAKPKDKNPPRYTVVGVPDGRAKYHCEYRGVPPVYDKKAVYGGWDLKKPIYTPGYAVALHRDVLHLRDREGMTRWDFATGKKLDSWDHEFRQLSVSADGKRMVVRTALCARIVDGDTDAIRTNTHFWNFPSIRYQPDGKLRAEEGGRVYLWDLKTNTTTASRVRIPKGHREQFLHLDGLTEEERLNAFRSADGKRVVSGVRHDGDMLVRWFDDTTGKELGRLRVPGKDIFPNSYGHEANWFDDEGTVFGYLAPDNRLVLVECATGKTLPPIGARVGGKAPTRESYPVWLYSQTGSRFILAIRTINPGRDKIPDGQEYRLLDRDGQLVRQFRLFVHARNVNQRGVVSPDGRIIAVSVFGVVRLYETATGGQLWPSDLNGGSLSFSPDSKFFALAEYRGPTVTVWDLDRSLAGPTPPAVPKTAKEAEALWEALNDESPRVAIPAGMALAGAPDLAVKLLKERLRGPDAKQLAAWIAKLADKDFAEREAAEKELSGAREWAAPALRAAVKNPVNAEQRLRLTALIAGLNPKPIKIDLTGEIPPKKTGSIPPYLREVRALEVLERIGTPEAKTVIESLAKGDTSLMVTREAKLILTRWR